MCTEEFVRCCKVPRCVNTLSVGNDALQHEHVILKDVEGVLPSNLFVLT